MKHKSKNPESAVNSAERQNVPRMLLALIRSAMTGTRVEEIGEPLTSEQLSAMLSISKRHDLIHLLVLGLKQNDLLPTDGTDLEKHIFKAVFRHEQMKYEYEQACAELEKAKIPFLPLKGSVLRKYYPEPWMRTSCDVDILVRREDLERGVNCLVQALQYEEKERATHDVSLFSPSGKHVELHFDLVEEGRANSAIDVLNTVWQDASPREGFSYWYEMSDAFFYFYHIAHMAKHFETGGCGVRPFLDLWILDSLQGGDFEQRRALLSRGGLLKFAESAQKLSRVWFGGEEHDGVSFQLQQFILSGGAYGTADNRVVLQQKKRGGRIGYLFSRIFIPYAKLKRYYPILEKHKWLTPFMQVRRWFMLFNPKIAQMAKRELVTNRNVDRSKAEEMNAFLQDIGL